MTDSAYAASWLVYFNGVEVPATSVNVQATVGAPPQATVTMPPSRYLRGLGREDRVRCTVFYLDHHAYDDPTYCLLFDGEIVQRSSTRTASSKSLQFVAVDMIAVLTQMFPFFVQNAGDIAAANLQTTRNTVATAAAYAPTTQILLGGVFGENRRVIRPFDILRNILTLCLGEILPIEDRSIVATQFFSRWTERVNFLRRFAPSEYVDEIEGTEVFPLLRAAQAETSLDAMQQVGNRVATSGSYYQLVQAMFNHVYYDLLMMLAPSSVMINETTYEIQGQEETVDVPNPFVTYDDFAPDDVRQVPGLVQYLAKPKIFFGLPPVCNIFWPCMTTQNAESENYARQPTRTYIGNSHALRALQGQKGAQISDYVERALTVAYPREAQAALEARRVSPTINLDNFLVYPEEFFKGPVYNNMQTPTWFTYLAQNKGDQAGLQTQAIYANMEHFRKRGGERNGSVSSTFNPYVVHGFPTLIVDNASNNEHLFADCVSVSHTLTQNEMVTNIGYTMVQGLDEVVERVGDARLEFPTVDQLIFAPAHPINELRQRFQRYEPADEYYQRILYKRNPGVAAVARYTDIFGVQRDGGIEDIDFTYGSSSYTNNDTGYVPEFVTRGEFERIAKDHDLAMKFNARPVCTLDEYITFQGERGLAADLRDPSHPTEGKAAPYYVQILNLVQGPGLEPGSQVTGGRCSVLETDTRLNWHRRLIAYRNQVYNELAPQRG